MRWFRLNVRSGAWCALVAMVLQLALTFGHVHVRVSSAASPQFAAQDRVAPPDRPRNPTNPLVDHCVACTLIHMAGAGAPAATASLPLPGFVAAAPLTISVEHESAASHFLPFWARGPPIA